MVVYVVFVLCCVVLYGLCVVVFVLFLLRGCVGLCVFGLMRLSVLFVA